MTFSVWQTLLCSARWFANVLLKSSLNLLQFFYHQTQKQRNEIDKGEYQTTVTARGAEGIRQTFYAGTGVGVYQGELVVLQQWVFSNPPQWVIGKLRPSDVHLFEKGIVCELLQAVVILAHYLQSESVKNHLQNPIEISLLRNCPRAKQHGKNKVSSLGEHENVECPLQKLAARKQMPLIYQDSVESQRCPLDLIVNLLNLGDNPNAREPKVVGQFEIPN